MRTQQSTAQVARLDTQFSRAVELLPPRCHVAMVAARAAAAAAKAARAHLLVAVLLQVSGRRVRGRQHHRQLLVVAARAKVDALLLELDDKVAARLVGVVGDEHGALAELGDQVVYGAHAARRLLRRDAPLPGATDGGRGSVTLSCAIRASVKFEAPARVTMTPSQSKMTVS